MAAVAATIFGSTRRRESAARSKIASRSKAVSKPVTKSHADIELERLSKNPAEKQNNVDFYLRYQGTYNGEWKDGKREGNGKMKYNYGNIYEGEWKNDAMEGKGIMSFVNNPYYKKYEGEWKNDNKHGKGRKKLAKSESFQRDQPVVYEGKKKNGKIEGEGVMI